MIGRVLGLFALLIAVPAVAEPLVIDKQGSFFIGGRDVKSEPSIRR